MRKCGGDEVQRACGPAKCGVVLRKEIQRPEVCRWGFVGWPRHGAGGGERGAYFVDNGLDGVALVLVAVQGLEVDEQGGDASCKTGRDVELDELRELVTCDVYALAPL